MINLGNDNYLIDELLIFTLIHHFGFHDPIIQ